MFSEGDLVVLKSGGPKMVFSAYIRNICRVRWFNDQGELKEADLKESDLIEYVEPVERAKVAYSPSLLVAQFVVDKEHLLRSLIELHWGSTSQLSFQGLVDMAAYLNVHITDEPLGKNLLEVVDLILLEKS